MFCFWAKKSYTLHNTEEYGAWVSAVEVVCYGTQEQQLKDQQTEL